jgi:hypothetical protein
MVWPIFWILGGVAGAVALGAAAENSEKKKLANNKPKSLKNINDDIIDADFVDLGRPGADPFSEHVKQTWEESGQEPDEQAQEQAVNMLRQSYQRLRADAELKTKLSLEAAEKQIHLQGGSITNFEVNPIPEGHPGRHIRVEWHGDPIPKLHVMKVVGQPLTSDIARLMKNPKGKTVLVDGLTNAPASIFDPEEKTGVQTVYYAWLEASVPYSAYSVSVPELGLVRKDETATAVWGLELRELLLVKPTPKPSPAPEKPPEAPVPNKVSDATADEFMEKLLIAFAGVAERRAREAKLEDVLSKFVEAHGLEDEEEELASIGDAVLERYEKQLNEKGRS